MKKKTANILRSGLGDVNACPNFVFYKPCAQCYPNKIKIKFKISSVFNSDIRHYLLTINLTTSLLFI